MYSAKHGDLETIQVLTKCKYLKLDMKNKVLMDISRYIPQQ